MRVEGEEYFHIRSFSEDLVNMPDDTYNGMRWEAGAIHEWDGSTLNFFNSFWDHYTFETEVGDGEAPVDFVAGLRQFLDQAPEYRAEPSQRILKETYRVVRNQAMFAREIVFEEVRAAHHSSLPSRRTCLWVMEQPSVPFWWRSVKCEKRLYRLRLTGELHKGENRWLTIGTFSHNTYRRNAHRYWRGLEDPDAPPEDGSYECIFQGRVEVLEEHACPEELTRAPKPDRLRGAPHARTRAPDGS